MKTNLNFLQLVFSFDTWHDHIYDMTYMTYQGNIFRQRLSLQKLLF